jgi:hypothetical protein
MTHSTWPVPNPENVLPELGACKVKFDNKQIQKEPLNVIVPFFLSAPPSLIGVKDGHEFMVMVSSGHSASIISHLLVSLFQEQIIKKAAVPAVFSSHQGPYSTLFTKTDFTFELPGVVLTEPFYIETNGLLQRNCMIIGHDWLNERGVTLNFAAQMMSIPLTRAGTLTGRVVTQSLVAHSFPTVRSHSKMLAATPTSKEPGLDMWRIPDGDFEGILLSPGDKK